MKDYNKTIGLVFRKYRKEKKYSQQYVADAMHVSKATVHNWECGKRQMFAYQFLDLCTVLGLDADAITKEVLEYGSNKG